MITRFDFDIMSFGKYIDAVPYNTTMAGLYDAGTLYDGYNPTRPETLAVCYDSRVYKHFLSTGKITGDPLESIARSLHDHFIRKGILSLCDCYEKKHIVGVMGGSAMLRTDDSYRNVALISKHLTENGTLMINGGGPGAMEATSLGALMAGRDMRCLDEALSILSEAPNYLNEKYIETAYHVLDLFPQSDKYECLAIPTWLYGHEPTSPFASKIGKLFENSIREDLLLSLSYGGLIYAPGSAGTMQEIFQEIVQNHYLTLGMSSPMVFLNKRYWTEEMPAFTLLKHLSDTGKFKNLILFITDSPYEAVEFITDFQKNNAGIG